VRLLRRYARKLVLAFDADAAGQAAAERFYQWEKDHDLEVLVADLPPGVDPADLAGSDPERLAASVEGAMEFLKFRVDRVLKAADLSSPGARAKAAEAATEVIRGHPSPAVRDQYVMEVAGACRVEPETLRAQLARPAPPPPVEPEGRRGRSAPEREPERVAPTRPARDLRDSPKLEVLRHVVHDWPAVEPWIRYPELFDDELTRRTFLALMEHATVPEAIDAADPEVADLLNRLATDELQASPFDAVVRFLTEVARREVRTLTAQVSVHPDDPELLRLQHWLTQTIDHLRDETTAGAAAEQLVAWLGSRGEEGA
jgi:DNA primase